MNHPISHTDPSSSFSSLPLTLIPLDSWALVSVSGADSKKYLQGQLTCDLDAFSDENHTLTAHCDAKGKMWSTLRVYGQGEHLGYLLRKSVVATQVNELKKYAVFSKVTIAEENEKVLLGIAGNQARQALSALFPELSGSDKDVLFFPKRETVILCFKQPVERFIVICLQQHVADIEQFIGKKEENDALWLALDIAAGLPVIDAENSAQLLPQAVNLQAIEQAISFTKGCYAGQEMVARAKYRGANKRALYWLAGQTAAALPFPGSFVELKLESDWRKTGTILASVRYGKEVWLQVVLSNDLSAENQFRLEGDEKGLFSIQPLPYSLTES